MLTAWVALCAWAAIVVWPGPARWSRQVRPARPGAGPRSSRGVLVDGVKGVPGRVVRFARGDRGRLSGARDRPGSEGAESAGQAEDADLASAVEALAAALRAGLPTAAAADVARRGLEREGPGASFLAVVATAAWGGDAIGSRLSVEAADSPALAFLAQAWEVAERTGAPLAPTLTSASREIRERLARERRLAVLAAGPRATMQLLTVLPILGPLALLALGGADGLWAAPAARASVLAGGLLLLVGRRWAAAMVRSALLPPSAPRSALPTSPPAAPRRPGTLRRLGGSQ